MRTVSGGSRTSPPALDDDPHRSGAASLPKTARNRPHRSRSPHLGITLIRRGYPSRPFLAGQRLPYSGRAAAEAAARWETPSMKELDRRTLRSEEHTSELQSLMRISYAVFCLKKKKKR